MSYRTVDREQAIMNRGLLNSRTFSNIKQSTGGKPPEKVGASWQQTRRQVSQEEAGVLEKVSVFIQGASPVAEQQRICLQCRRPRRGAFDLWVGRIPWRRKGSPLKSSCLENPTDRGAQRAPVRGVAESRTRLSDCHSLSIGVEQPTLQGGCASGHGRGSLSRRQRLGEADSPEMLLAAPAARSRLINLGGKAKTCKRTGESFKERLAQWTLVVV